MKKKVIFLTALFLLIDILSKVIVDNYFRLYESITIIKSFFSLTKVYNTGASFSMFSGMQIMLIIISIIILITLFMYQKKFKENIRNIIAFSLLYSGIIGNLVDRVFYNHVIDFFDFTIFGYDFPVFNFADSFIVIGTILLIIGIIKKEDMNENSSK